jgi:UrcA family protein
MLSSKSRTAKRWFLVFCIAAGAAAAPSVQAQSAPESERVRTRDLDLTTEAGRDKLDRRIAAAAWRVCAQPALNGLRSLSESGPVWRCRKKAIADAAGSRSRAIANALATRPFEPGRGVAVIHLTIRPTAMVQARPDAGRAE